MPGNDGVPAVIFLTITFDPKARAVKLDGNMLGDRMLSYALLGMAGEIIAHQGPPQEQRRVLPVTLMPRG